MKFFRKPEERETIRLLRAQLETHIYSISSDILNTKIRDENQQKIIIEKIRHATTLDQAIDILEKLQNKHKI